MTEIEMDYKTNIDEIADELEDIDTKKELYYGINILIDHFGNALCQPNCTVCIDHCDNILKQLHEFRTNTYIDEKLSNLLQRLIKGDVIKYLEEFKESYESRYELHKAFWFLLDMISDEINEQDYRLLAIIKLLNITIKNELYNEEHNFYRDELIYIMKHGDITKSLIEPIKKSHLLELLENRDKCENRTEYMIKLKIVSENLKDKLSKMILGSKV